MTDDPWKTLELDATSATPAEVKRCYARLLKNHRPDRDPEGFMRLRSAYETAQAILRGETPSMPVPQDLGTANEPASIPASALTIHPEIQQTIESLHEAARSKVRQKVRLAWAAYEEAAGKHDLDKESRWLLFIKVFEGHVQLLADACTDELLLNHLRSGEMRLLRLVTDIWSKQGDAKRLDEFCVSLNRQRTLADSETGALAMVVTAIALGAWNPDQAARFAQRAFPRLPTTDRKELAERVDFETMLGRLVAALPQTCKIPWVEVLRHGESDRPWRDVITHDMVTALLRHCGPNWPGFPLLHQRLRPESWLELKALAESLLRGPGR
jgi:hypothetical protein